jgi:hypothetical protein
MIPKAHVPFMFYVTEDDQTLENFKTFLDQQCISQGTPGETFRERLEQRSRMNAIEERKKSLMTEL